MVAPDVPARTGVRAAPPPGSARHTCTHACTCACACARACTHPHIHIARGVRAGDWQVARRGGGRGGGVAGAAGAPGGCLPMSPSQPRGGPCSLTRRLDGTATGCFPPLRAGVRQQVPVCARVCGGQMRVSSGGGHERVRACIRVTLCACVWCVMMMVTAWQPKPKCARCMVAGLGACWSQGPPWQGHSTPGFTRGPGGCRGQDTQPHIPSMHTCRPPPPRPHTRTHTHAATRAPALSPRNLLQPRADLNRLWRQPTVVGCQSMKKSRYAYRHPASIDSTALTQCCCCVVGAAWWWCAHTVALCLSLVRLPGRSYA